MQTPALTVEGMYHPGVVRTQAGELANGFLAPSPLFVGSQMCGSYGTLHGGRLLEPLPAPLSRNLPEGSHDVPGENLTQKRAS
jgi:hypothetical protein